MDYTVKCRICGEQLTCDDDLLKLLGEHLIKNHSEVDVVHFLFGNGDDNSSESDNNCHCKNTIPRGSLKVEPARTSRSGSTKPLKKDYNVKSGDETGSKTKDRQSKIIIHKNLQRTTVENWRIGGQILTCPQCGSNEKPYVRKQKNKITFNPLGTYCLLGCWPLCFLPLLMCGKTTIVIFCRCCGCCLGEYDKKTGQVVPLPSDVKVEIPQNMCDCTAD